MPQPFIGTYGQPGIAVAGQLRDAGCNTLWFHGFDEDAFQACAGAGLQPCVEFRTFREDFTRRPDLVPIGVDGHPIRYGTLVQGVCLSKTDFISERCDELKEGVAAHEPAGVWLDYLSGAGWFESPDPELQESCFCPECVADFCDATGIDATSPAVILGEHADEWTAHMFARVAALGREFATIIRAAHPQALVGAYMCPWTPQEFDGALTRIFAQDYTL
ncbi:MAG: hypothetical protein E4H09_01435, partial [Spirochaetales bacterium]